MSGFSDMGKHDRNRALFNLAFASFYRHSHLYPIIAADRPAVRILRVSTSHVGNGSRAAMN